MLAYSHMIFAYHCAYTFTPSRAIQAKVLVERQLEIQPLAPDLGHHLRVHQNGSPFRDGNVLMFSGEQWLENDDKPWDGVLFFVFSWYAETHRETARKQMWVKFEGLRRWVTYGYFLQPKFVTISPIFAEETRQHCCISGVMIYKVFQWSVEDERLLCVQVFHSNLKDRLFSAPASLWPNGSVDFWGFKH